MKLPSLLNLVTDDLAIDLGTSRTRVYARGRGIVVNEPSLMAYDMPSREVVAVGLEALELEGRASEDIQIISPLQDGVVADSTFAGKLLSNYLKKARDGRSSISRRVLISVASDASDIEQYALRYASKEAGVTNVHFINKGLVTILGAGIDPDDQRATLVMDVGAGTTTIAAMVHNHLIFTRTLRLGGNDMDKALVEMVKANHNLHVGPRTAERVKIELGSPCRSIRNRPRWSKAAAPSTATPKWPSSTASRFTKPSNRSSRASAAPCRTRWNRCRPKPPAIFMIAASSWRVALRSSRALMNE